MTLKESQVLVAKQQHKCMLIQGLIIRGQLSCVDQFPTMCVRDLFPNTRITDTHPLIETGMVT